MHEPAEGVFARGGSLLFPHPSRPMKPAVGSVEPAQDSLLFAHAVPAHVSLLFFIVCLSLPGGTTEIGRPEIHKGRLEISEPAEGGSAGMGRPKRSEPAEEGFAGGVR